MELSANKVHVWVCHPDQIRDPDRLSRYERLLNAAEKSRQERFLCARHRHRFLVSRALVRTTLSCYADISADQWTFTTNEHGRPDIVRTQNIPPLRFNLSHTTGIAACAVVLGRDIGVDVENTQRHTNIGQIAGRYFSPIEREFLNSLPEDEKRNRFFQLWTLKESFTKAKGIGLTLPFDRFAFLPGSDGTNWRIRFDPSMSEDSTLWQFWVMHPTPNHTLAVSIHLPSTDRYRLVVRQTVPEPRATHVESNCRKRKP